MEACIQWDITDIMVIIIITVMESTLASVEDSEEGITVTGLISASEEGITVTGLISASEVVTMEAITEVAITEVAITEVAITEEGMVAATDRSIILFSNFYFAWYFCKIRSLL